MKKLSRFKRKNTIKRGIGRKDNLSAWMLMLPMVIILYLFVWRPTVLGTYWSFFKMNAYTVGDFCGLDNYRKVITNTQFSPMLWNTIQYVFWSIIIGFIPPYALAVMLNEIIHGKSFFRVAIYIPVVIPGIAAMLMWYFMYYPDQSGLLNMILAKLGMEPYRWLNDPRFTIIGIIIYCTWKNFGGALILYFAALQGVSTEVYEAALIDGAGPWGKILECNTTGDGRNSFAAVSSTNHKRFPDYARASRNDGWRSKRSLYLAFLSVISVWI